VPVVAGAEEEAGVGVEAEVVEEEAEEAEAVVGAEAEVGVEAANEDHRQLSIIYT
jgi:hypothetical protein